VNALTKSMAVVTTQDNLPNLPNFQYSSIILNGSSTLYTVTNWLSISPVTCILETHSPFTIISTPKLTRLSTVHAFDSNNMAYSYDVHADGPNLSDIWLFNGSVPLGYYNTDGTVPGTMSKVLMWSPMVPDNSKFMLPVECFPKSVLDGKKKKRDVQVGAPSFPPGFTMYVKGFVVDSQVTEKVYYYDSTKSYVRVDDNGYTILQRGSDVYRYSNLPQLTPYPCEYYYAPSPVWVPPLLEDFILNVTFQGSPAQVWQGYDHYVPTQYQYWYYDTTQTPVYIIDSTMVGGKVLYFDPTLPGAGIFDIPPFCFTL